MKNVDSFVIIGLIFLVAGIIGIFSGFILYNNEAGLLNELRKNGVKTTAIISDIQISYVRERNTGRSARYHITIKFTDINNEEITAKIHYPTTSEYVGMPIDIYYDPQDPSILSRAEITQGYAMLILCASAGLLLAVPGGLFANAQYRWNQKRNELIGGGHFIMADVAEIRPIKEHSSIVNIYLKYTDEHGREHSFKIPGIMKDPAYLIKDNKVQVWVDPNDYKKYFIDIASTFS